MVALVQNVVSVQPGTQGQNLTTTHSDVLSNQSSGAYTKIQSIIISNVDGSNDVDVNVSYYNGSTHYYIAKTVTVPADSTLVVLTKDTPIILQEFQGIYASASANSDAQIVVVWEQHNTV
jgi:hypothetical protein